ncbi:MAG TPA: SBBP repeat-containing protein [Gemmatimonadales bacterium]|nr:SBBP repeat-containing protein [Gemmatimonadales bacterium]
MTFTFKLARRLAMCRLALVALVVSSCQDRDNPAADFTSPTPVAADSTAPQLLIATGLMPAMSTQLGGLLQDQVRDVATDAQGNFYVTGGTQSLNFITTSGAYDRTENGNYDVFVTKLSPTGQVLWSTLLGGPKYDRAYAIEIDPQGFIVVAGRSGGGLPATAGSFDPTFAGSPNTPPYGPQDGFVCKLTPDGASVVFCSYLGTADERIVRDVAIDNLGNLYLPYRQDLPGLDPTWAGNGYAKTWPGNPENIIVKVSPDGKTILAATYFGGNGKEAQNPSIRWMNGRVYLAGQTTSSNLPTPGGFDHTLSGATDDFIACFDDQLTTLIYATYVGGSAEEDVETHNLAVDPQDNAYIASSSSSADLPGVSGGFQTTRRGPKDAFIVKVSPTGALVNATYFGGSSTDDFQGIATDGVQVVVSGNSISSDVPLTDGRLGPGGMQDALVVRFSADLRTLLFSQQSGGSRDDFGRSIVLTSSGHILAGGMAGSLNWFMSNQLQSGFGGGTMDGVLTLY